MSINIHRYFEKIKKIQVNLLDLLDEDNNDMPRYESDELIQLILQNEMKEHEFKLILNLILSITNNYYRNSSFFDKIFKIILGLKVRSNKLFQILKFSIYLKITKGSYYFL
mgnify:CR=1 FL=1